MVPELMVKLPATVIVPEGAVKVPVVRVNAPSKLTGVYAPRFKVVALVVNFVRSATESPLNPDSTSVVPKLIV